MRGVACGHCITPDTKDWTWVLQRPCPECGFDTQGFPVEAVPGMIMANVAAWQPTPVTVPSGPVWKVPLDRSRSTSGLPNGSATTATRPTGMSSGPETTAVDLPQQRVHRQAGLSPRSGRPCAGSVLTRLCAAMTR